MHKDDKDMQVYKSYPTNNLIKYFYNCRHCAKFNQLINRLKKDEP